jgi:hypothetical protein
VNALDGPLMDPQRHLSTKCAGLLKLLLTIRQQPLPVGHQPPGTAPLVTAKGILSAKKPPKNASVKAHTCTSPTSRERPHDHHLPSTSGAPYYSRPRHRATVDTSQTVKRVVAGKRREPTTEPTTHLSNLGGRENTKFDHLDTTKDLAAS